MHKDDVALMLKLQAMSPAEQAARTQTLTLPILTLTLTIVLTRHQIRLGKLLIRMSVQEAYMLKLDADDKAHRDADEEAATAALLRTSEFQRDGQAKESLRKTQWTVT